MCKRLMVFLSVVALAVITTAAVAAVLAVPVPVLDVRYGMGRYSHGQRIAFPRPFGAVPVVVTSAQLNGKAVSSCAFNNSPGGFQISLIDDNKNPVQAAWVQWIAFLPKNAVKVIGGVRKASNGQRIVFAPVGAVPVIVTNAQIGGRALNSAAANIAANGFTIVIRNQDNAPIVDAWVQWMAVIPTPINRFKAQCAVRNSGDNVVFAPPLVGNPVYVLSAQCAMEPMAASAVDNRADGFKLSLVRHDGSPGRNAWTSWIGYAGP